MKTPLEPAAPPVNRWTLLTSSRYFIYVLVAPLFLVLLAYVVFPFFFKRLSTALGFKGNSRCKITPSFSA